MKRAWLCAPVLLILAGACSGKGNTGRLDADPALLAQVPWVNGFAPLIDPATKAAVMPGSPVYPPIGAGTADPGSRTQFDTAKHRKEACAPLEGIEVSQWHHDFEPVLGGTVGVAQFFSAYDDKTEGSWHVPGDAAWYKDIANSRGSVPPWGLAADRIENGPSCDGAANAWALHIRGGRFNYFGGGTEHPLELDCSLGGQKAEVCEHVVDAVGDGRGDKALDVSDFDGVAFWARRGPDGATGLMVLLQDKYTSDRLARTYQGHSGVGYCQRIKQCYPRCAEGSVCTPAAFGGGPEIKRCIPEGARPQDQIDAEPAFLQQLYPPCGEDTCVPPSYDPDEDYNDTQCKPYNFTGLEENYWCFGDEPPAAPDQRCGDGFVANVSLSTDWQFYTLPFKRFQQVGFGKKAPPTDVLQKTLYSIAFLFSVGNTDFFVDNLTFYRNRNQ